MSSLIRAPGARLERLGDRHVAYSALSGDTHVLTDAAAAVLDALGGDIARDEKEIAATIAQTWDEEPGAALEVVRLSREPLLAAGLVRTAPGGDAVPSRETVRNEGCEGDSP